ncbi:MAG: alpha/beta fold hydrolase [Gemmatimonadetes bacterium]|nr:alpha/beta fold hydrolase [Gemmatimonadota bacterium]
MTGLLLALLMVQAPQAERYGIVVAGTAGDTVSVERVLRTPDALRAEVFVPNRARLEVAGALDGRGCPRDAEAKVFPWRSAPGTTPVQQVSVRLDGDSVRVAAVAGDVRRSVALPMPGAAAVLAGDADAFQVAVVDCALAAGADSVDLAVVAFPNLRRMSLRVLRHGADVRVIASDTYTVKLAAAGRGQQIMLPKAGQTITRVSAAAVEAVRFAAVDYGAPPGAPYRTEEVHFEVEPGVVLAGTLALPAGAGERLPALVTISGSGAQDRDSYAPVADGWRPFRQIAATLARRGWTVLRFDDRGVGASTGAYGAGSERTAAADVAAAVAYLRRRPEIDARRVVLLGHADGGRIARLVAAADHELAGLVRLPGAADTRAATRAQALWLLEHTPQPAALPRDSLIARLDRQLDSLAVSGRREVFRWDAAAVAAAVRVGDVAIMHGGNDRQVPSDQAAALAAVFRRAGAPRVSVRVFPGLNHLLVPDSTGDFTRYDRLPSARVDQSVLGAVADWLGGLRRAP